MNSTETPEEMICRYFSQLVTKLSKLNQGDGTTHAVLCEVFYYTRLCNRYKIDPIERLSDEQHTELADGLIQAVPTMDQNLRSLMLKFGDECLDEGRFMKSGRQFLQEDYLPKLKIPNERKEILKKGLDELGVGDNFEEISDIIDNFKNDGGPTRHLHEPALDLRGVPMTHDWYTEGEREESRRLYGECCVAE